ADPVAPGDAEIRVQLLQLRGEPADAPATHPDDALVLAAEEPRAARDVADRKHAHAVDSREPDARVDVVVVRAPAGPARAGFSRGHGRPRSRAAGGRSRARGVRWCRARARRPRQT